MRMLLGAVGILLTTATLLADPPKKTAPQLPTGQLDTKAWLEFATTPLERGEIDRLVNAELKKVGVKPAAKTTDEQFIRRAYLDLTGRLPMPADINEFLDDKSADKRAKLIDKLLATKDFAKHWAQYWKIVVMSRITDIRARALSASFEHWLKDELMQDKSWSHVARSMLTAKGKILFAEPETNGQLFFILSRRGMDAATEVAAETSRIFLGIQIQCAQCHDHPSDIWKRQQFHEFAAYFAKYREVPVRDGMKQLGSQLMATPFKEYQMPDREDPKKTTRVMPRFLDGNGPKGFGFKGVPDEVRRRALADSITSPSNPWFAGAYVNRIWGELLGQAFYTPIDDMGPQKDAMMPAVLGRVAASWRGNEYNIKQLFRDIMTSDTYQRQIRPGESGEEHMLFATHNPVRMNADSLWQSLNDTLGTLNPPRFFKGPPKGGPFGRFQGLEGQFKQEFAYDPSTKAEEIEGSITQALLLMNNAQINQKIKAQGTNLLARILSSYSENDEALRMLYLRTLARRPTDREMSRCRTHIEDVGTRADAFEDILWALINSTEYQTKR